MQLHNYQQRIVDFCYSTDSVILSVGMGLGKTAAILHFIEQTKPASILIVAPKRVAETVWCQEAEKWGLAWSASHLKIVAGDKRRRTKVISESRHLVIGRDNLADVEGMRFDLLVIDELTSFKNHTSKRSQSCYSIQADKRIGLTGTFLTKGAIDIFGQFVAVGIGGTNKLTKKEINSLYYRWLSTNFRDKLAGSGLQFKRWELINPLESVIRKAKKNIFTLDSADWLEIPEVELIKHEVKLLPEEMNEYTKLNTLLYCNVGDDVIALSEGQKFAKLQTLCNGFIYTDDGASVSRWTTKIDNVTDFVCRCVAEGENVLLFYAFKEEKKIIEGKLLKDGIKVLDVKEKGSVNAWNSGKVEVLLAHPASAGHGLNLQNGGRILVWSTIPYDYELYSQANARLARQGQQRGVQIHTFVASGTVEVMKVKSLNEKDAAAQQFLNLTK